MSPEETNKIILALPSIAERGKRLSDLIGPASLFCNIRPLEINEAATKQLTNENRAMLKKLTANLTELTEWQHDEVKNTIMLFAEHNDLKLGKVMQPVRAAITGGRKSGDLVETLVILGKEEVLARLEDQTA